jgi:flagellum-specific peptidoglycan hydrolase FlgJ
MGIRKRNYASGSIWDYSAEGDSTLTAYYKALFFLALLVAMFSSFLFGDGCTAKQRVYDLPPRIQTMQVEQLPKRVAVSRRSMSKSDNPDAPRNYEERNQYDYIKRFRAVALAEERKYGVPAPISLAQGLLESRSGQSKITMATKNHFGMKCFSKHCKEDHCMNIKSDGHKDFFRQYKTDWESWRSHSELLATRYKSLIGKDWEAWAEGLEHLGYADDAQYAESLKALIKRWKLAPPNPYKRGERSTASILME